MDVIVLCGHLLLLVVQIVVTTVHDTIKVVHWVTYGRYGTSVPANMRAVVHIFQGTSPDMQHLTEQRIQLVSLSFLANVAH